MARSTRIDVGHWGIAFFASIATAFTGFLVQSNFDSQWISFEAKDGLNAVGIGAWFNVTNAGQSLLLHVCLLPLVLGVIVVMHVLLVRKHGVVPPIPLQAPTAADRADARTRRCSHERRTHKSTHVASVPWAGPARRYDIVKEFVIAIVVVSVLTRRASRWPSVRPTRSADLPGLGHHSARQLLRHRRRRARRHQRVGRLRAPLPTRAMASPSGRSVRRSRWAFTSPSTPRTTSSSRH